MDDADLQALLAELRLQREQIAALTAEMRPARPAVTVAELYARWKAALVGHASLGIIAGRLRGPLKALGDRVAASVKASDWNAYRATRRDLHAATLNQELGWLKAMLNWGVREGLLQANPLQTARKTTLLREGRETAPVEADVQAMLAECRPIERVLVLAASDAGMRNGEIRHLQWSWLDRERMEIHLPNSVCKFKKGGQVPMTSRLLAAMEAMPRRLGSPYVLPNPAGKPYSRMSVCRWMRELVARAGVVAAPGDKRVRLHDCRHGYATNAVERGVRIEIVSDVLRHSTLEMTRAYVQRRPGDLAAARELFEAGIKRDRR